jgi:hypothetical protein
MHWSTSIISRTRALTVRRHAPSRRRPACSESARACDVVSHFVRVIRVLLVLAALLARSASGSGSSEHPPRTLCGRLGEERRLISFRGFLSARACGAACFFPRTLAERSLCASLQLFANSLDHPSSFNTLPATANPHQALYNEALARFFDTVDGIGMRQLQTALSLSCAPGRGGRWTTPPRRVQAGARLTT